MADQTKCPIERNVQREESRFFKSIYQQRKWSDLTLINKDKRYMVHKNILAASIPHFENMLTIDMIEAKSNEINLDYPPEVLEMIIDWAYCQPITIKLANVRQLFDLADYMRIPELTVECLDFLFDHSSDSVLTEFSHWIDQIATDEARKMLERHVCLHFCDLITTQDFLNYDVNTVNYIISMDNLNIENEIEVCDVIIKWVATNWQDRLEHLSKLLKQVHWASVDCHQFISKFVKNPLVQLCKDTRPILKIIFDLLNFGESDESKKLNLIYQPRTQPSNSYCLYALSRSSKNIEVIHVDIQNQYHKTMTELSLDDALDPPKFYDEYSEEYIINSSQIIRIDWKRKKNRFLYDISSLYSLLFGRVFEFEGKRNGNVQFWKGSRCIQLALIPDYCLSILAVTPYRGQFFIVGYPVKDNPVRYLEASLMMLKFDPNENIWSKISIACTQITRTNNVKMTIYQNKIFIFLDGGKYLFYDIVADSWSYPPTPSDEIIWTFSFHLNVVVHNSMIIQCFKHDNGNFILREVVFRQDKLVKLNEITIRGDPKYGIELVAFSNENEKIHTNRLSTTST